jgi:hypothetical protein
VTVVATKRRRTSGDTKPQAPRARAGQAVCGVFLRASTFDGTRFEQHCDARLHGDDERHSPGPWTEPDVDPNEVF